MKQTAVHIVDNCRTIYTHNGIIHYYKHCPSVSHTLTPAQNVSWCPLMICSMLHHWSPWRSAAATNNTAQSATSYPVDYTH